jgi:predicted RND superfamily exporter protein
MRALESLLGFGRWGIVLHLVIAAALVPGILRLENDNSPEVFFAHDARAMQHYEEFRREFGGGQTVRIAISGTGLWTTKGLKWLGELETHTASLPGVETAVGLASYYRWHMLEWPPSNPTVFRSQVMKDSPEFFAGLISLKGETVTMLVVLTDLPPSKERELLYKLYELTARTPPDVRASLSGLPVFHLTMDRSLVRTVSRFMPLLFLLAVIFLGAIFRRPWEVLVPLIYVGVCQIILFGVMGYAGVRLNLVNIILAPLLFVITLATAVHIQVRFRQLNNPERSPRKAVTETYRSKGLPVLWTGLTTLVAFGSLATAGLPPLQSVGTWSALGIGLMTVLAFTFYPLLLASIHSYRVGQHLQPFEKKAGRWGGMWAQWAVRHRFPVITGMAAVLVAGLLGIVHLTIDDNLGKYFPPHHPVRTELEQLQNQGVGVFAAELVLSFQNVNETENKSFQNPSSQKRLAELSSRLRSNRLIYGAVSSGDFVEMTIRSILVEGKVTESIRWMALGLMQTIPDSRRLLYTLMSQDGRSVRISLLIPMLSFNQAQPLFEWVKSEAATFFPSAEIRITGQYPLILLAQGRLINGLIVSFSVTLLCVATVFLLLLRNIRLTALVLIPNIWPVVLVLGGMGCLGIPLDSASIMTAAIVLGLAVDDTFHTLGHFLKEVSLRSPAEAIVTTLERTAPAHILTSVILTAGFAIVSLSELLPVSRLGALSATAIVLALVGDLILIPTLLGSPQKNFN